MRNLTVRNESRGAYLGGRIGLANRFWTRLRGLLGRTSLADGEGLLIAPSRAVHMYGMRFPIDVAFLDRERRVVATYSDLPPGGRTKVHRRARFALELPTGTLARTGTVPGDLLTWSTT